eukprot:2111847-Prymnesium_polylepis.2
MQRGVGAVAPNALMGLGCRAAKCRRGRGPSMFGCASTHTARGRRNRYRCPADRRDQWRLEPRAQGGRRRQCPGWPIWPPRPTRTCLERPSDGCGAPSPFQGQCARSHRSLCTDSRVTPQPHPTRTTVVPPAALKR